MTAPTKTATMVAALFFVVGCDPTEYCSDTCAFAGDGECDDGRPEATTGLCDRGTDCTDCGTWGTPDAPYNVERPGAPIERARRMCVPAPDPGGAEWQCNSTGNTLVDVHPGMSLGCGAATGGTVWGLPCPSVRNADATWACRDGARGVGCYYAGVDPTTASVDVCYRYGSCDDGTEIERCLRMPTFTRLSFHPGTVGYLDWFDESQCSSWFQIGDSRNPCGACLDACNLSAQEADRYCGEPEPDAGTGGGGVDPDCRALINMQVEPLRNLTGTTPCTRPCIDRFVSCAERSNCDGLTACNNSATSCLTACL